MLITSAGSSADKLPLAGGTMTGAIEFNGTSAYNSGNPQIHQGGNANQLHLDGETLLSFRLANSSYGFVDSTGWNLGATTHLAALSWTGTQTSAGASVANDYRNSTGDMVRNVQAAAGQLYNSNNINYMALYPAYSLDFTANQAGNVASFNVSRVSNKILLNAPAANSAALCTAGGGGTKSEVVVYGASHSGNAGAVAIKSEGIVRASNGTWTAVYSLAAGTHQGSFWIFDSLSAGYALFTISGTTIALLSDQASGITYVDAGSAAAGNVAFRVNAGNVEINVGTSITASTKFAINFQGMVV